MNPHNNKYRESDLSLTSKDQDSEASLIIIPDEDSRTTLYSTIVDEIDSNSGGIYNYTHVFPDKTNCKSTETSFIDITEDYSTTLSKNLSESLFYTNAIIEPYPQTFSVSPANLGDQLITRNQLNTNGLEGENSSNLTIDLTDHKHIHTIVPYLCGNSSRDNDQPTKNYQSSCRSKNKTADVCTDKTKTEVCEGKTKPPQPKSCKINSSDSNISLETKKICASLYSTTSMEAKRPSAASSMSQDTKNICESAGKSRKQSADAGAKHSCMNNDATRCCATVMRAPKCESEASKPPPKKEPKASCCSESPQAKKSLSDSQKCMDNEEKPKPSKVESPIKCPFKDQPQDESSNDQNKQAEYQKCPFRDYSKPSSDKPSNSEECPSRDDSSDKHSICQNQSCPAYAQSSDRRDSTNVSAEKILSCTSSEEKAKECKNKPSYCSNTMLSDSEAMMRNRFSALNLDKCPSKINIENMQYMQADGPASNSMDDENLSNGNLLTESQRNINAYYGFSSKPRNIQNCMKVKVIPSTAHLTNSELSVIKLKLDRNETIPKCKMTSDDFTSMAKGFFGCIYSKTKDESTFIKRESVRLLDAINHRTQSCNTENTLPPPKVFKDKSTETPLSYLMEKNSLPLAVIDQSTSGYGKPKRAKLSKESPPASFSTVNLCSCSRHNKSLVFPHIAVREPSQQINSMFTAIKSKIFSIFREDDTATETCRSKMSKSSSDSDSDDSDESETVESMLPKRN